MNRIIILIAVLLMGLQQPLFAGAWTLPKRTLWVKTWLFIQRTDERYVSRTLFCGNRRCENGERTEFFFNGEVASNATYFDFWYGVTDRIELQFQLPYFDISFEDDVNPERPATSDIGDIRFGLRYRLPFKPVVTTARIGAKAPTGFFNKDAEVVPVGDGQWDLELSIEFGRSLWPTPVYVDLEVGYRFRFEPAIETTNLDPGDEFTLRGEAGLNITNSLLIKAAIDGFWGQEFSAINNDSRFQISNSDRRILYFEPGLYWQTTQNLALEASVRTSLSGKNHPAGEIFGFGASYSFGL